MCEVLKWQECVLIRCIEIQNLGIKNDRDRFRGYMMCNGMWYDWCKIKRALYVLYCRPLYIIQMSLIIIRTICQLDQIAELFTVIGLTAVPYIW